MSDIKTRIKKLEELQPDGNKPITWLIIKYDCDGTKKTRGPTNEELKVAEDEYIRRFGGPTTTNIATLTCRDGVIFGKDVQLGTYSTNDNPGNEPKETNQAEQDSDAVKFQIGKGYIP